MIRKSRVLYKHARIVAKRHMTTPPPPPPPLPKLVSIDAYETIYTPYPKVHYQYSEILRDNGIYGVDPNMIKSKFSKVFQKISSEFPNYGKLKGLQIDQFWYMFLQNLIMETIPNGYHIEEENEDDIRVDKAITAIIAKLGRKEAYMVHQDVVPFLNKLDELGISKCIASNADCKVTNLIIDEFKLPFGNGIEYRDIYLSYDMDLVKPDVRFFEKIVSDYCKVFSKVNDNSVDELKKFSWHVGDEMEKDVEGALKYGMNAVLIDRFNEYGFMGKKNDDNNNDKFTKIDENFYVISNLNDFFKIFGF